MLIDHRHSDSRKEQDRHLDSIIYFVNAWAAQHVANAIKDQKERAEKAEARVKELEAWMPSPAAVNALPEGIRRYVHDLQTIADPQYLVQQVTFLTDQCDGLQKLLVAGRAALAHAPVRQALQAEGKHPAPCARHCEANAFQIEVRRLEAESAHKQAIIDRLMLEYCPDEMSAEQTAELAKHQVCAPAGIVGSGPNAKEGSRPCWTPDCGTF